MGLERLRPRSKEGYRTPGGVTEWHFMSSAWERPRWNGSESQPGPGLQGSTGGNTRVSCSCWLLQINEIESSGLHLESAFLALWPLKALHSFNHPQTFIHWWRGLPHRAPTCQSGAIRNQICGPKTHWHVGWRWFLDQRMTCSSSWATAAPLLTEKGFGFTIRTKLVE